jgi:hypothetical protein
VRFWYGSVEFWVGGTSHGADDHLNAAVCGNCGYSSLYLQNMAQFRHVLGFGPPVADLADAPGAPSTGPQDRTEVRAFRKAVRRQKKSGGG